MTKVYVVKLVDKCQKENTRCLCVTHFFEKHFWVYKMLFSRVVPYPFPKVKMIRIPPTNVDRRKRPCGKSSWLNNNPYLCFPIETDKKRAFTRFNLHECDFKILRFCRKHITSAGKPLTYYYGRVVSAIWGRTRKSGWGGKGHNMKRSLP